MKNKIKIFLIILIHSDFVLQNLQADKLFGYFIFKTLLLGSFIYFFSSQRELVRNLKETDQKERYIFEV